MRKTMMLVVAAAVLWSVAGLAQETPKFDAGKVIAGERSFRTYCASCHGKEARGDGPLGKDLKVPPANLTKLSEENGGEFPYQDVYKVIEGGKKVRGHGSIDMPAWGDAFLTTDTEEEAARRIDNLCQFIWSLQPKE